MGADGESVPGTERDGESEASDDHLEDVPEGAGCTEIWEHLSRERDEGAE